MILFLLGSCKTLKDLKNLEDYTIKILILKSFLEKYRNRKISQDFFKILHDPKTPFVNPFMKPIPNSINQQIGIS